MKLPFQKIYALYMVLWPGLALLSLRYIPATQEGWLAHVDSSLIALLAIPLFAAIAIYFVFPTEVIRVPNAPLQAFWFVSALPLHLIALVILSPHSFWETIAIGFCVECLIAVSAIAVLVMQKRSTWKENVSAVVILLGTTCIYVLIVVPFILRVIDHTVWSYAVILSGLVTGIIQNVRQIQSSQRADLPGAAGYILIGVFALFVLPGIGALVAWMF